MQDPTEMASSSMRASKGVVVLILVGLPGSGKSTFCGDLLQKEPASWIRICQDTISNGRPGSREQCLKQVEKTLLQGSSNIVIDRCNLNKEQRYEFVQLATKAHADVHALILDLPLKLCIQRATRRTKHEGGLQGKTAAAAIVRMYHNKEFPCSSEGFSLITTCQSDLDIKKAAIFYLNLDGNSGPCMFECTDEKHKTSASLYLTDTHPNKEKQEAKRGWKMVSESKNCVWPERAKLEVSERKGQDVSLYGGYIRSNLTDEGIKILAFPSISTSDFCFDHKKATNILVERISKFLGANKDLGLRLVLVDINRDSDMLLRVGQKALEWGLDDRRFFTLAGDITTLYTDCGLRCNFIANTTNWRLRGGGGGVNAAIFKAAGPELEIETKRRAKTLSAGSALVVPLSEASPLRRTEGVTHVIHVLGPNMNPNRPNYLEGDYDQGCKILDNAYSSIFESFYSLVKDQRDKTTDNNIIRQSNSGKLVSHKSQGKPQNAFEILMQASRSVSENDQKHARKLDKGNKQTMSDKDSLSSKTHMLEKDLLTSEVHMLGKDSLASISSADDYGKKKLKLGVYDEGKSKTLGECKSEDFGFIEDICGIQNLKDKSDGNTMDKHIQTEDKAALGNTSKAWGAWAQGLRDIALHPEMHQNTLLQVTDDAVVIRDKYPKGKHHFLVVSREDGLDSILDLRSQHLLLLEHMHSLGQNWASMVLKEDSSLVFRLGYHSDPSMRQFHMHVISQDFYSPFLKNKKHWNSFTTHFFHDSKEVIEELRKFGKIKPSGDQESLQKVELRCHRCHTAHPNLPRLKNHIRSCQAPFSPALIKGGRLLTAACVDNSS